MDPENIDNEEPEFVIDPDKRDTQEIAVSAWKQKRSKLKKAFGRLITPKDKLEFMEQLRDSLGEYEEKK